MFVVTWAFFFFFFFGCARSLLQHVDSLVVVCKLSCSTAQGILVPQLGTKPASPVSEGRFLTTGPPWEVPWPGHFWRVLVRCFVQIRHVIKICWIHPGQWGEANSSLWDGSGLRVSVVCKLRIVFTVFCFFFLFVFWLVCLPPGKWDLSAPIRDGTATLLQWKHRVLTTGPPGKSQFSHF